MPTYEYVCDACGVEFEEIRRVVDRLEPTEHKCGHCGVNSQVRLKISGGAMFIDPYMMGRIKPPSDFTSRLKEIAKESPGHNMNIRD